MRCRPRKWLWGLIPLLVPFAAAWWLGTTSLEQGLKQQVEAKLRLAGLNWATVAMDGRDAVIVGEAETPEARNKAIETVEGQYGLRRVVSAIQVVPQVALNVPTVNALATSDPRLPITGTWHEGVAKVLTVSVGDKAYLLGRDPELSSAAGVWSLRLKNPPADGTYDVKVEIGDGRSAKAADATAAELVLDTAPPRAPTAAPATGLPLTGTWDEDGAKSLKVTVAGKTYVLGIDGALSSDGRGNWKLALTDSFAAASYDVEVETSDALGNIARDGAVGEFVIAPDQAPPASPTITPFAGGRSPAELAGTWPEGDAVFLAVTVHGRSYIFGSDPTLSSDGRGNWRLALSEELPSGVFDVAVTTSDASGNRSSDLTRGEIQVKGAPAAESAAEPAQPPQPAPAVEQTAAPQPTTQPSVPEQPAPGAVEQSAALQPTAQPTAQPSALEQPAAPQPTAQPSALEQPAAPQPTAQPSAPEQPAAPQPTAQPSAPEQPAAPQPIAQPTAPEQPAAPQPTAQPSAPQQPAAPQPAAQPSAPEQPAPTAAQQSAALQPTVPEQSAPASLQQSAAAPEQPAAAVVEQPATSPPDSRHSRRKLRSSNRPFRNRRLRSLPLRNLPCRSRRRRPRRRPRSPPFRSRLSNRRPTRR